MGTSAKKIASETQQAGIGFKGVLAWRVMPPAYTRLAREGGQPVAWRLDGCLERFIRFHASATPAKVLAFSLEYGPLQLCSHRRRTSTIYDIPFGPPHTCDICKRERDGGSLAVWVACATALRSALLIASALRTNKPTEGDWWRDLAWGHPAAAAYRTEQEPAPQQWVWLSQAANAWVQRGLSLSFGIEPESIGDGLRPRGGLTVHTAGLFGILAAQLAAAVSSVDGMYECQECGILHARERAPRKSGAFSVLCFDCKASEKARRDRTGYRDRNPEVRRRTRQ